MIVAVSDALRRQMAETLVPRPSRIRVVVNGIDTRRFQPRAVNGSLRGELGLPVGAPVIGSIGRLDPIKGYDVMLQAFALLRARWRVEEGAAPTLLLVGDGPERARLAALIEREGLCDATRLVGWREDVEQVYPVFDVFSLSSWSEGTSLGLLEAMSCGVCPVVTAVGGSPAALGDRAPVRTEGYGRLFEALSAAPDEEVIVHGVTFSEAVYLVFTDPSRTQCVGVLRKVRISRGP